MTAAPERRTKADMLDEGGFSWKVVEKGGGVVKNNERRETNTKE